MLVSNLFWSFVIDFVRLTNLFSSTLDRNNLQNIVSIKSYNYKNLVLSYGPNKEVTVDIYWSTQANEFKITFSGGNVAANAHSIMTDQLQSHLNRNHNLTEIVHILHETYQPLSSVIQLPAMLQLGIVVRIKSRKYKRSPNLMPSRYLHSATAPF